MFTLTESEQKDLDELVTECKNKVTPDSIRLKKDCGSNCSGKCGESCQAVCKSTCSALF